MILMGTFDGLSHREIAEDLRADSVVPMIRLKAELVVRFHSVLATVLQLVGPQLVDQAERQPGHGVPVFLREHRLALEPDVPDDLAGRFGAP